ncbi:unnamed protein product [Trypanosoma congolense IL3000]|uniref:WGS project CAEQ00000000 data, annotated contig 784 n=1 Tax=Trypanosoma congolense (strain IL3000) TaxID=1068625 RepID=F9WIF7_TRYCI|nr:unnamed protein product [Trypanosoma congolense IL3000]
MPKRLAWSPEGEDQAAWLPERPQPKSGKEEAALLSEDDEWMVAIRRRQPPRNPSWTMQTTIREVLVEGMKDPHNLNLFDFLHPYYRDVPETVARFTVGDFLRNPERCIQDKLWRNNIGMSLNMMRARLRQRLLHTSYGLFSYHIKTLEDWVRKGRKETVEPIARSLLDQAVKQVQEAHTQAEEPVQRKPRGPRQGPVFLPSSSSSTSWSSCHRRESSPSSDVEFLVEFPSPLKKEEDSPPHGTPPVPRRKRPASPDVEVLSFVYPPKKPPRQEDSPSSDVEFLGAFVPRRRKRAAPATLPPPPPPPPRPVQEKPAPPPPPKEPPLDRPLLESTVDPLTPPCRSLWTLEMDVGIVLLEGIRNPHWVFLDDFLRPLCPDPQSKYRDGWSLSCLLQNPARCIPDTAFRDKVMQQLPSLRTRLRIHMLATIRYLAWRTSPRCGTGRTGRSTPRWNEPPDSSWGTPSTRPSTWPRRRLFPPAPSAMRTGPTPKVTRRRTVTAAPTTTVAVTRLAWMEVVHRRGQ